MWPTERGGFAARFPGPLRSSEHIAWSYPLLGTYSTSAQIVDLSEPSRPFLVGMYATPRPARDVAVTESLVFVVMGDSEREGEDREVAILARFGNAE